MEDETAIDWRIKEIQNSKYEIDRSRGGVIRGVMKEEGMGKELGYINNLKFYDKMIQFLEQSFKDLKEDKFYYEYVKNEIWNIVISYFKNLKQYNYKLTSFLDDLKKLTQQYEAIPQVDNFHFYIKEVKKEYVSFSGTPEPISSCIQKYLRIKSYQYLDIVFPEELYQLIQNVINFELRQWVNQGFYGFIDDLERTNNKKVEKEKIIQKTIATQLENFLLRKGLRNSDITQTYPNFYREVEKLDGDKIDLIISYGAIGSIMVEIKRAGNSDLIKGKLEEYKTEKFLPYMNESNCDYGVFLIFRDNKNRPKNFNQRILDVKKTYENYKDIQVIGIDCVKS